MLSKESDARWAGMPSMGMPSMGMMPMMPGMPGCLLYTSDAADE